MLPFKTTSLETSTITTPEGAKIECSLLNVEIPGAVRADLKKTFSGTTHFRPKTQQHPSLSHGVEFFLLETADDHDEIMRMVSGDVRTHLKGTQFEKTPTGHETAAKAPAIIIPPSREIRELAGFLKLEEGYAEVMETQRFFELLRTNQRVPDYRQFLGTFTPQMLSAACEFQEPTPVLITQGRSFGDLIAAINEHKTMPYQIDAHPEEDEHYLRRFTQKSENWGAYFVEGARQMDMHDFDETALTLGERLWNFSDYKKAREDINMGGMDRWKYAHLLMPTLKEMKPNDLGKITMLDEDPLDKIPHYLDFRVPVATWIQGGRMSRAMFSWTCPENRIEGYRFRRSVGGPIQF